MTSAWARASMESAAKTSFDPAALASGLNWESLGLPRPEGLESLLQVAYSASLYSNEGRSLRFSLAVCDDKTLAGELPFAPAASLDVRTLRQLALCADPEKSILRVRTGTAPKILSIAKRPDGPTAPNKNPILQIEITDPGCIAISVARSMARFSRDQLSIFNFDEEDFTSIVTQGAADSLVQFLAEPTGSLEKLSEQAALFYDFGSTLTPVVVNGNLWVKNDEAIRRNAARIARPMLLRGITRLAAAIKSLGHGGAFLLLPQTEAALPVEITGGQRLLQGNTWIAGMLEYCLWLTHFFLTDDGLCFLVYEPAEDGEGLLVWRQRVLRPKLTRADRAWQSDTSLLADLTRVDGALVLQPTLAPLAFGTRLGFANGEISGETAAYVKQKGNRHNSMATAVSSLDGAAGVVVSQDGDVTLFTKEPGAALTHRELPI